MGDICVVPLVDEGLGSSTYLLDLDDGRALAVDASRELRALRAASELLDVRQDNEYDAGHAGPQDWADQSGHALEVGR